MRAHPFTRLLRRCPRLRIVAGIIAGQRINVLRLQSRRGGGA